MFGLFSISLETENNKNLSYSVKENPKEKPFFGRKEVSSNFLNTSGMTSMNHILCFVQAEFPNLAYCPLLPRVVQFFLWFVPEKIAKEMVIALLNENSSLKNKDKFFCCTPSQTKKIMKKVLFYLKPPYNKKTVKSVVIEAINNMFSGILRNEVSANQFLPFIFLLYLLFGIKILTSIARFLISQAKFNQNLKTEDLKRVGQELDFSEMLNNKKIPTENEFSSGNSSISNLSDLLINFVPRLSRPSKIFLAEKDVKFK